MQNDLREKVLKKFTTGLKGIFAIRPFKELIFHNFFVVALVISLVLSVLLWFFPDDQLSYIEITTGLILAILPTIIGLALAAFAIGISQISEKNLERMAETDVHDENAYSLYQELNAAFSITALAQLIPLFIAILITLSKPLTLKIVVSDTFASLGNIIVFFFECLFFLNSLMLIVDLIQNIFTTGQLVNYFYLKEKLDK
ncbi:MAG: hypothetical protein FWH41_07510 [Treponema sp.]|nr:hypothetical protein [Treponema sp.]